MHGITVLAVLTCGIGRGTYAGAYAGTYFALGRGPRTKGRGRVRPAAEAPGRRPFLGWGHLPIGTETEGEGAVMSVAMVTGASRGLGRALAGELAARGWDLVLSARGAGPLEEAAAGLRGRAGGGRVVAVAGDVTSAEHRAELVAAARSLGGLDLLVNNAGVLGAQPLVPLAAHPLDGLREAFEVNVVGPLGLVQEALPLLRAAGAAGRGAVLNISSDAAVVAYPTWGAYGATKAAGDLMSAVLAVEEPELRVWWADPGSMATRMMAAAEPEEDLTALPTPEQVAPALLRLLTQRPPSGRYTAEALTGPPMASAAAGTAKTAGPLAGAAAEAGTTAGPAAGAAAVAGRATEAGAPTGSAAEAGQ